MSSSSDRGQTEPLAAIVAVVVVCLSLGLYAGVLDGSLPGRSERDVASTALAAVEDRVAPAGIVRPSAIGDSPAAGPSGYQINVTVVTETRRWAAGPRRPESADATAEAVSVRVAPARVVPGRLRVAVWR